MAIAHICSNCAKDLARQPAICDPYYSLPLVICPNCNKAAVRRPNYYSAKYKTLLRITTVFFTLLVQAIFIIALAGASVAWIFLIGDVVFNMNDAELARIHVANIIVAFALTSLATGAWLTVGLSHIPKLKTWIGWSFFLVVVNAISLIFYFISQVDSGMNLALAAVGFVIVNVATSIPILVIMVFATAGIPIGKFILYLHRVVARERWRWRKRRRTLGRAK